MVLSLEISSVEISIFQNNINLEINNNKIIIKIVETDHGNPMSCTLTTAPLILTYLTNG
jgi:hypothetical protein